MKALPELDFGASIAFFLPGVLAFYAMGHLSLPIAALFADVVNKDKTLGASVLILIGSLGVGMILSGFRALVLDRIYARTGVITGNLDYSKLRDKDTLAAYKVTLTNTYRFYQFYGNTMFALLFFIIVRYLIVCVDVRGEKTLFSSCVLATLVLFLQSRSSLGSTHKILGQVLGNVTTEKLTDEGEGKPPAAGHPTTKPAQGQAH